MNIFFNIIFHMFCIAFGIYLLYTYFKFKKIYNLFFGPLFIIHYIYRLFLDSYISSEAAILITVVQGLLLLLGVIFSIKPVLKQIKLESKNDIM